jgi:hypothetical protein
MDIVHCQFEHLSDAHTSPGHQFQHQTVAGLPAFEKFMTYLLLSLG